MQNPPLNPRNTPIDRLVRNSEPYHFQRDRQRMNNKPRPAQPNTSQPNQKITVNPWGMSTMDYWGGIMKDYLNRRQ